ncbi:MinD/ParA family protein [Psychrobacillus lasiicapitis]|uniref:MinD/ParA family protein n=1 Tax=Psychrobacillus lasiicapitis TaxID=1636719 RepID=A0A544TF62_9BACI|nr:MinD/ParA family protein [Psychrobacillus lasiicapitis]TQR16059.1 MinD/ParA family protein [Psychrobacillus lasiicapitis]GGA16026.1 flagellum site-determining protein YlxH [Psychrobacillus lasiicapitis]
MRDQAEELRLRMLQSQQKLGRSIAVVSGKGGVGKSNFSMNFTTTLSEIGKKVVLIDMDIGMGNIHILLGKTVPTNLKDYLVGEKTLEEVMFEGPNNLQYISGGSGLSGVMEWNEKMFNRLIEAFEYLQKHYDYIVFDMGAGATSQTLDLLVSVDDIIVITTAEPTSITDAYSMMKFIYFKDPDKNFFLLCNRAFSEEEGVDTTARLKLAMSKFLSKEIVVLGSLPEDPVVRMSVKEQVPFSILYPNAAITKKLKQMVNSFTKMEVEETDIPHQSTFISRLKNLFSRRS